MENSKATGTPGYGPSSSWDWEPVEAELAERERIYKEALRTSRGGSSKIVGEDIEKAVDEFLVCICGHEITKHSPLNNEGRNAHCDTTNGVRCACNGSIRPVLKVSQGNKLRFRRRARGNERPHALTGAVKNLINLDEKFEWLVNICDYCGNSFMGQPVVHTLDEAGQIQRPHKPLPLHSSLGRDTGKHVMICAICDYEDQLITGYKEP